METNGGDENEDKEDALVHDGELLLHDLPRYVSIILTD